MYIPNTPAIVSFPGTASTATNSKVIKQHNVKPQISALLIASGLISAAISIWLLSVTLSAHAQEYCPSGAVVTAQSQCPGAVGPIDNLTKSILLLNYSGVDNAKDTAIKPQKDNKSNTGVQTAQNTISNSNMTRSWNMTAAGNMTKAGSNATSSSPSNPLAKIGQALSGLFGGKNMTKSAQPSQPLSQPQMPNTVLSSALNESFQKCYKTTVPKLMQETLPSNAVAAFERPAIQNMTAPIPFRHILNFSATEDQQIYDARVRMIKPIADCMRQEQQQQPSQQQQPNNNYPYQQQPNSNYPQQQPYSFPPYQQPSTSYLPPRILSHSAYTSSIGTVHIVGEVINQSPVTAKFVKIIVTFYNAYNRVVGTDFTYTQPSDLAPGQRAPFDILVLSGGIPMNQVRNYALTVDAS